jgi:hypothetical protein
MNGNYNPYRNEEHDRENTLTNANFQEIVEFQRAKPPSFYRYFDPILVERWIMQLDKIFEVLGCTATQKVTFATYMLEGEAEHWWRGARRYLEK